MAVRTNNIILVSGMIIISLGAINAALQKKPETPVLAGGIGVLLIASLMEAIGPGPGKVASALLALAAVTVVTVEAPPILTALQKIQKTQGK